MQEANVAAVMTPIDGQNLGSQEGRAVPEANAPAVMTPMDNTSIDPAIQAQLDSLSAGDLDRLADTYHPEAVVILNRPLARITEAESTAIGQAKVKSLLAA